MVLIILFYNLIDFIYNEWKLYPLLYKYYLHFTAMMIFVSPNSNTTRVV
jgi:hypothetical protein